jgi:hypothetical protein
MKSKIKKSNTETASSNGFGKSNVEPIKIPKANKIVGRRKGIC